MQVLEKRLTEGRKEAGHGRMYLDTEKAKGVRRFSKISYLLLEFVYNLLVRYGGEVILDKPLSQREEYLRQMKVLSFFVIIVQFDFLRQNQS